MNVNEVPFGLSLTALLRDHLYCLRPVTRCQILQCRLLCTMVVLTNNLLVMITIRDGLAKRCRRSTIFPHHPTQVAPKQTTEATKLTTTSIVRVLLPTSHSRSLTQPSLQPSIAFPPVLASPKFRLVAVVSRIPNTRCVTPPPRIIISRNSFPPICTWDTIPFRNPAKRLFLKGRMEMHTKDTKNGHRLSLDLLLHLNNTVLVWDIKGLITGDTVGGNE